MNVWLILIAAGLLTYIIRLSFILTYNYFTMPGWLQKALRFVPPAVLSAIILPEVFMMDGNLAFTLSNERIFAALASVLVAWKFRSVVLTVVTGMVVLYLARYLL